MNEKKKLTFEEKVIQKLKDDGLAGLLYCEDDLADLAARAVKEALFQPRRVAKNYGGWDEKDSPTVEAARKVADDLVKKASQVLATEMLDSPAIRNELLAIVVQLLPAALMRTTRGMIENIIAESEMSAEKRVEDLAQRIRDRTV